jgi:hypothetical protein
MHNMLLATANNLRLDCYNPSYGEQREILSVDQNSSFLYCLMDFLPLDGFEFMDPSELFNMDIMKIEQNTGIGFVFLVDLIVPIEFHDCLNEIPPAPVKKVIAVGGVSEVQQTMDNGSNFSARRKGEMLCLDHHKKTDYLCYYKLLQYYVSKGCTYKLKEGVRFREAPFLKDYSLKIMNLRKKAKADGNVIMDNFLKMTYSSFVGKTISTNKDHTDYSVVSSRADALRFGSNHRFVDWKMMNLKQDTSMFFKAKGTTFFNMPMVLGFTVDNYFV